MLVVHYGYTYHYIDLNLILLTFVFDSLFILIAWLDDRISKK